MTLVVVGLSHRSAPFDLLEATNLDAGGARDLRRRLLAGDQVREAVVLSTCNRTEVYVDGATFHGAVAAVGQTLAESAGLTVADLRDHLYVHHEDRAVAHTFAVACGLDSMAIGEAQILGQLRASLSASQQDQHVGPALNGVLQRALRVGKRAHHETGIDAVSVSLVEAGLAEAESVIGPLAGAQVLVVGAGAMSGLAMATITRRGVAAARVISRTRSRAERLAASYDAQAASMSSLAEHLRWADLVITCTGASGRVITTAEVEQAVAHRDGRPLAFVDLALPHDVEHAVAGLPGVHRFGLEELGEALEADGTATAEVAAVRGLVADEVGRHLERRRMESIAPTVAALRSRAADVVTAELARLDQRLPELGDSERAQVHLTVHRVVEKLLHGPTVRMKELAAGSGSGEYAAAVRELFDLDPSTVAAVSVPSGDALEAG